MSLRASKDPVCIMEKMDEYVKQNYHGETFSKYLLRLIDQSGLTDAQVYARAGMDRKLFSKIRCDTAYTPRKKNVIALALALKLDNKTAKTLIKKAGYILTGCIEFDVAVRYCFENGIYDIEKIDAWLHERGLPTLIKE